MKNDITLTIDGRKITAMNGQTLLAVCRENHIHVPVLCYHEDLCISGFCRLCSVEVEGRRTLESACCTQIENSMIVYSNSQKVRDSRKVLLELLLSDHQGECFNCAKNGNCELQDLAEEFNIHDILIKKKEGRIDHTTPIYRDMGKCISCRRCIQTCIENQGVGVYGIVGRGKESFVSTFLNRNMDEVVCINCGQCINHCPTAALTARDDTQAVWDAIKDPSRHVVIQTAPSPRAAIGECFGEKPGKSFTGQLNTALKKIGFDRVFDTNFGADLTIIEEGTELMRRLYSAGRNEKTSLPMFTSCSPGWVKYLEHFYPEMIDHLSTAKSPQQMFGTLIKTFYAEKNKINPENIVSVSLMPCTAKKYELSRPEMNDSGFRDVDFSLTTREIASMIKQSGMILQDLEKSQFDNPFSESGSGVIFGATGGVMESAVRTIYELATGKDIDDLFKTAMQIRGFEDIRYVELEIPSTGTVPEIWKKWFSDFDWLKGSVLKMAVVHGTAKAKEVLDDIQAGGKFSECHFIEFMACPGGCLGGGGMPIPTNEEIRKLRAKAIYSEDDSSKIRLSYKNPAVVNIYEEYIQDGPNSAKSHDLFHTGFTNRGKNML